MRIVKNFQVGFAVLLLTAALDANAQTTAYGIDGSAFPTINFASLPIPAATPVTIIGPTAAGGQGGDFGLNSLFYATSGNDLVTISLANGSITVINAITGVSAGQSRIGMGYDPANNIMYLASTDLTNTGSELYTVNLSTAVATLIGPVTNAPFLLAIAINCSGEIFGFDDQNDNLLSIDPGTAGGTIIGPLNFDAGGFAQDADFDFATGVLYWTAFNGSSGELRTVDFTTGNSTQVKTWSADFIAFAILGDCQATGVGEDAFGAPSGFELFQNYPNPFNPSTTIQFDLPRQSEITLSIFNLNGQLVRTLVGGRFNAGSHKVVWDGRDDQSRHVPGGLYVMRMRAGEIVQHHKMLLIK